MKRVVAWCVLLVAVLSGCADDTPPPETDAGFPIPPIPAVQACRFPGTAPGLVPRVRLEEVTSLAETAPVEMLPHPSGGQLLLTEAGRLLSFEFDAPEDSEVILDLSRRAYGFLVVPEAETPSIYMLYEPFERSLRLSHFTLGASPVETSILEVRTELGGSLASAEPGVLLVAIGDVEADPSIDSAADDPGNPAGGVIRVQVTSPSEPYSIPEDNPYLDERGDPAVSWAIGLRAPRDCTFDPAAEKMYCVDRGQLSDEVNRVGRRSNLGWPLADGRECVSTYRQCELSDLASSLVVRAREGASPECGLVGGRVYRGTESPTLDGVYLYADACSGQVRAFLTQAIGFSRHEQQVAVSGEPISGFGTDERGEVYVLGRSGRIRRIVAEPNPEAFPETLSQSGCFSNLQDGNVEPAPGVVPYEINSPLWSDGSIKDRFFALPAGTQITPNPDGTLSFPEGTVLIKNFAYLVDDEASIARSVETRVLLRGPYQWEAHTYRWNEAGTDADLLQRSEEVLLVVARDGEPAALKHDIPDRFGCGVCHGTSDPVPIGPRLDQLRRALGAYEQLDVFGQLGVLEAPIAPTAALPDPADESVPIEDRARAYLDVNCGHCHRPGGWVPSSINMDLRYQTPFSDMNICDVVSEYRSVERLRPGVPEDSLIIQRMEVRGLEQMPPFATGLVDPLGVSVVSEWISSLRGCPDT